MNTPIDNLILRELNSEDSSQFFELIERNRARLTDYFPQTIATITSPETCDDYIDKKMKEVADKDGFGFVLEDETDKLKGFISVKNTDWTVPKCELAFFIDKDHIGRGIMTVAISTIVAWCFDVLKMNKVYLITATNNHASRRIAEKNGFEVEGILRDNFKLSSGILTDMAYYGILSKMEDPTKKQLRQETNLHN